MQNYLFREISALGCSPARFCMENLSAGNARAFRLMLARYSIAERAPETCLRSHRVKPSNNNQI